MVEIFYIYVRMQHAWRRIRETTMVDKSAFGVLISITMTSLVIGTAIVGYRYLQDELLASLVGLAAPLSLFALVFIWYWFKAPSEIWANDQRRIAELSDRLVPKISLSYEDDACFLLREKGVESRSSFTGKRQFQVYHPDRLIRIGCGNTSDRTLQDVEIHLVSVEKKAPNNEFKNNGFSDSVQLPWSIHENSEPINLPPYVPRYVDVIFQQANHGEPEIAAKNCPFQYSQIFFEPGEYRLTIQASGLDSSPTSIVVHFLWAYQGDRVVIEGAWQGS